MLGRLQLQGRYGSKGKPGTALNMIVVLCATTVFLLTMSTLGCMSSGGLDVQCMTKSFQRSGMLEEPCIGN